ncbi:MAG: hypothetical protein QOI03_1266 [Solirubrobacteraceae bacterium]|jgi:hypothetical protein|nr:hypothetical protein [Solirubrobacteraceae bacterium]
MSSPSPSTRIARTAARTSARRGIRIQLVGIVAALGVCLAGASAANADRYLSGVHFSSIVTCSTSVDELTVMSGSNARSGSLAMIYLYSYASGRWMHENQWHNVSGFNTEISTGAFNFVGHHRYEVWIRYAQATSSGWVYSGEYPRPYYQRNANGYGTYASRTCHI